MTRLLFGVLLLQILSCSGLPVYDHPADAIRAALNVSLAQVNSQSLGTSLLRVTSSNVKRVNILGDSDIDFDVSLEFFVRETTCNKRFAEDPTSCGFRVGPYQDISCSSRVLILGGRAKVVSVECNHPSSSSSESHSSEERVFHKMLNSKRAFRNYPERFPSQWDPYGKQNQYQDPWWEEEHGVAPGWE